MATKTFCDICKKEAKKPMRVGWSSMYCLKCWNDKKKWPEIHKIKKSDF